MRRGRTTEPVEKSRTSAQLNWMILVVSSVCLALGVIEFELSADSESDLAGLTRAASFLATRLAWKGDTARLKRGREDNIPHGLDNWSSSERGCGEVMHKL